MAKITYVEPAAYFTPKARKILEEGNKTENKTQKESKMKSKKENPKIKKEK